MLTRNSLQVVMPPQAAVDLRVKITQEIKRRGIQVREIVIIVITVCTLQIPTA